MAVHSDGAYLSLVSDADLSALTNLFRAVSLASSTANPSGRKVVLATSHTDANIIGILNNNPGAGETASVRSRNAQGTFKMVLGVNTAAVSVNDRLTVDTDGGGLKTTTSSDQVVGIAMESGVAGQVIEVLTVNYKL